MNDEEKRLNEALKYFNLSREYNNILKVIKVIDNRVYVLKKMIVKKIGYHPQTIDRHIKKEKLYQGIKQGRLWYIDYLSFKKYFEARKLLN